MSIVQGKAFNAAVVKALGLEDRSVYALTLRLHVHEAPTMVVEEYVREGAELVSVLSEYVLTPKPGIEGRAS